MTHRRIVSRYHSFWGLVVLMLLLASVPITAAAAQPPALMMSVTPNTVNLAPGQTVTVTVTASNPTDSAAADLSLSWFSNTSLQVDLLNEPDIASLPAGADAAWTAQLHTSADSLEAGIVHWRLDYTWLDEEGKVVSRVLFSQLTVSAPTLTAVEEVASVTVASTLTELSEQRPGTVSLIVENKQNAPLQIVAIRPSAPDDVTIMVPESIVGTTIAPRRQLVIPFAVTAEEIVQPGEKLLLFGIDLSWQENGVLQQSTLVATQKVAVGIFGESQILTLLGVPAFFLLPGFLLLTAFKLAWRWQKSEEDLKKWPLPGTGTDFWAVAITLSLLAAVVYPILTQWLGVRRDYLQVYGLQDVFNIWFGSVLVGIGSYSLYRGGKFLWGLRRQRMAQERTPTAKDSPKQTIERLVLQEQRLARETAIFTRNGKANRVFFLQDSAGQAGPVWVAPLIFITNRDKLDPGLVTELETAINAADAEGSLEKIYENFSQLEMTYADWPFKGPLQATDEELTRRSGRAQSIVSFQ